MSKRASIKGYSFNELTIYYREKAVERIAARAIEKLSRELHRQREPHPEAKETGLALAVAVFSSLHEQTTDNLVSLHINASARHKVRP